MHGLGDMETYAYGLWPAAVISIGIFIFFTLSFLRPKKRWEWRSMGAFSAFVIALFTEMYGGPTHDLYPRRNTGEQVSRY